MCEVERAVAVPLGRISTAGIGQNCQCDLAAAQVL